MIQLSLDNFVICTEESRKSPPVFDVNRIKQRD
jgi:hypothetical protein